MGAIPTLADTRPGERRPMSEASAELFVRLTMAEMAQREVRSGAEIAAEFKAGPLAIAILANRLPLAEPELRFSVPAVLFLASLASTPGDAVLWAHYLVGAARRLGAPVTMASLAEDFPLGFPTDEGRSRIWDAQKQAGAPAGNLLDTADAWRSAA